MSDYYRTIDRWYELTITIEKLSAEEKALREGLFNGTFPNPKEGTNTVELPDGRKLKGQHRIYRNVREDLLALSPLQKRVRDLIFKVKHDLRVSEYRKLEADLRKEVDAILDIKPGMPGLTLVLPPGGK